LIYYFILYVVYFAVGISIAFSHTGTCLFWNGIAKCCAKIINSLYRLSSKMLHFLISTNARVLLHQNGVIQTVK